MRDSSSLCLYPCLVFTFSPVSLYLPSLVACYHYRLTRSFLRENLGNIRLQHNHNVKTKIGDVTNFSGWVSEFSATNAHLQGYDHEWYNISH